MIIKTAEFVMSNSDVKNCPPPKLPEYGFIGRSNVGKSSLINMLTNNKNLAKTSATPGKTQLINHFLINQSWYLADLPGLGYAKVSKDKKQHWDKMIYDYLLTRKNLLCVFVLIDSRLELQKVDEELMGFLGQNNIPFVIIFTKIDKLKTSQKDRNINAFKNEMLKSWETLPEIFITSSEKKLGRDEALNFIEKTNKVFVREH